jgi:hypothetical protein
MRREESPQIEAAGQDSFLDVTTNIVGILIILVMVVGMRAKNSPAPTAAEREAAKTKVETLGKQVASAEYDVRRVQQQLEALEDEAAMKSAERESLATMMVAAEKALADHRSQLDSASQEEFDLKRQLEETKRNLDLGQKEIADLDAQKPPTQQVNHYPTPLSRTVLGKEIHFQLKDGRLAYVPLDEFVEDLRTNMRSAAANPTALADKVGIAGPRNGFEFHYTMDVIIDRGRGLVGIQTREWQMVPMGLQQGETVDQALAPRSEFRAALARFSSKDTTVTLWTYPNSFADYRRVKEELYRLGYATAGRPLPNGVLIGGSNRGSKSSAQ